MFGGFSVHINLLLFLHYFSITGLFHCFQVSATTNSVVMNDMHASVCTDTSVSLRAVSIFQINMFINSFSVHDITLFP